MDHVLADVRLVTYRGFELRFKADQQIGGMTYEGDITPINDTTRAVFGVQLSMNEPSVFATEEAAKDHFFHRARVLIDSRLRGAQV